MGQKVNPISLRLGKTNRHFDSCWYDDYNYTDLLLQGYKIESYLQTVLRQIQYPEGRLSIENLPNKTNVNLFYCNPTNSRRKKNKRFQLQEKRENKKKQLYKSKKNTIFTQPIERKKEWRNSLRALDCRFFDQDWKDPPRSQPSLFFQKASFLKNTDYRGSQPTKGAPCLPVSFANNPDLSPILFSYQFKEKSSRGQHLLPKVLIDKKGGGDRWLRERFFVRYLLSFFYCRFLQNKRDTLQNTLYAINSLYNKINLFPKEPKNKKNQYANLYPLVQVYKPNLESFLCKQYHALFNLSFFRSWSPKQGARLLVQEIVYYLERRVPFRRIKTFLLKETLLYKHVIGIRVSCSGRVGGRSKKAQRSKTQSAKIGQTPLGAFSSQIDFACKSAKTKFGLIGVKLWICYK